MGSGHWLFKASPVSPLCSQSGETPNTVHSPRSVSHGESQGKSRSDGWNAGEQTRHVSLCLFLLVLPGRHDHPSRCLQGIHSLSSSGENQHSMHRHRTMNKCLVSTAPTQPPSSPVWVQIYSTRCFFRLMGVIKDNSSSTTLFTTNWW